MDWCYVVLGCVVYGVLVLYVVLLGCICIHGCGFVLWN